MPATVRPHKYSLSDPTTAEVWLANIQMRFDDSTRIVDSYRTLARQILGWIGVILVIELNLLLKLADNFKSSSDGASYGSAVSLGLSMILQMACFTAAAAFGYSTLGPRIPEAPVALLKRIQSLLSPEARERIAAFHTRSYDVYYAAARRFSRKFNALTAVFVVSLWLALAAAGFVFWAKF